MYVHPPRSSALIEARHPSYMYTYLLTARARSESRASASTVPIAIFVTGVFTSCARSSTACADRTRSPASRARPAAHRVFSCFSCFRDSRPPPRGATALLTELSRAPRTVARPPLSAAAAAAPSVSVFVASPSPSRLRICRSPAQPGYQRPQAINASRASLSPCLPVAPRAICLPMRAMTTSARVPARAGVCARIRVHRARARVVLRRSLRIPAM
ncbi:hypothetical protein DFH11DRAFT_1627445 [Phellopilus nigrolimitatus]|nr:hypothetical protein DFH11DRAFT_1627445 [Phellopilus nigrolimitatus]